MSLTPCQKTLYKALQLFKQTLCPELCQFRHRQPRGYSLNQNKGLHCLPKCTFIWEAHGLGRITDGAQRAAALTVN